MAVKAKLKVRRELFTGKVIDGRHPPFSRPFTRVVDQPLVPGEYVGGYLGLPIHSWFTKRELPLQVEAVGFEGSDLVVHLG